jgi:hypothetical protein
MNALATKNKNWCVEKPVWTQGDQIGRIFAHWMAVYFKQFFLITEVATFLGYF